MLVGDDREEAAVDGLDYARVDRRNRLRPLAHVERAEPAGGAEDRRACGHGLRVHDYAALVQCGVNAFQCVDHACDWDASERPAAERDIEAPPRDVELVDAVDAEADAPPQSC